jgi:hypothetical protein
MRFPKIILALLFALLAPSSAWASHFTDVPSNHPYYTAINYVYEAGIVAGYGDGNFGPEDTITRAQLIKIITLATMSATDVDNCLTENSQADWHYVFFQDIFRNEWHTPFICIAKTKAIIQGYSDGNFRPNQPVSFVEAAKIIINAFNYPITENSKIWYQPFTEKLDTLGAKPMTVKKLDQLISRAEAASMIYTILQQDNSETEAATSSSTIVQPTIVHQHLLLLYPNINVDYTRDGVVQNFQGSMSPTLKSAVTEAFKNLPNIIANATDGFVSAEYTIQEIQTPITKISIHSADHYWLSDLDIASDIETYAPPGKYDAIHVVWHNGGSTGVPSYFGMGGLPLNNETMTYSSLVGGETFWWNGLGEYPGEPFLHEWIHGVSRFFTAKGYQLPAKDADGATEHGYQKSNTDGWMAYYRDLLQGKVLENDIRLGITKDIWLKWQ